MPIQQTHQVGTKIVCLMRASHAGTRKQNAVAIGPPVNTVKTSVLTAHMEMGSETKPRSMSAREWRHVNFCLYEQGR